MLFSLEETGEVNFKCGEKSYDHHIWTEYFPSKLKTETVSKDWNFEQEKQKLRLSSSSELSVYCGFCNRSGFC